MVRLVGLALRLVASLLLLSAPIACVGQEEAPLLCTGTCGDSLLTCPNRDGSTRATFDLRGLQALYPTFVTMDDPTHRLNRTGTKKQWDYQLSLCGQPAVPVDDAEEVYLSCVNQTDAAVMQFNPFKYGDEPSACVVAGRFGPGQSTVELYTDADFPALGPIGLRFNFTNGTNSECAGGQAPMFSVHLRCPFFLNGFTPDPIPAEGTYAQPNTTANPQPNRPTDIHPSLATSRALVGQVVQLSACQFVLNVDSVFACPIACLPPAGVDTSLAGVRTIVPPCDGRGMCRDVTDSPPTLGCLCNGDFAGPHCDQPASHALNASNAQTPMAIVSIVLLVLVLLLTVALFRKLRYLNRDGGQVYGNLEPAPAAADDSIQMSELN